MSIGILTLHAHRNPGSVLQAYALYKFLLDNGYDPEVIDYYPEYINDYGLKKKLINLLFYPWSRLLKNKFDKFISSNLRLSTIRYYSYQELLNNPPKEDVYILGSDQLWNSDFPCGNDPAYYLKFIEDGNKISYATSIGKELICNQELAFIKDFSNNCKCMSVREKSTSEQLSKLLNKKVAWVCDPVLLLKEKDYEKFIYKNKITDKYAVVYLCPKSKKLDDVISYIRKNLNYKIILIGGYSKRCYCDEHVIDMGPEDFLTFIKHSELVISSSFHATVFSHIFHKKFGVILPTKNGERIQSFLQLTHLNNRILNDKSNYDFIYEDIDYNTVDKKLNSFVAASQDFLISAINECLKGNKYE